MSSRPRRKATLNVKYNEEGSGGYPDGKPDTDFEKMIQLLNNQSFPSKRLAHVDDLCVYAMFATKARPESYRAIKPDTISGITMTRDQAGLFNTTVREHLGKIGEETATFATCQEAAKDVINKLPELFEQNHYKVLVHTILRYKLLYSPESNVQLEKVVFGDGPISGGLRARSTIRAGAYLLHACGSLSSNLHKPGHATIEATTQQLGPTGSRLILGPLRFVNHDCNPNSQLYPIPNSNAFTIITLKQIEAGESITVKYTEGGYWGECWCGTCKGYSTLMLPRHEQKDVPNPNKKEKKKRRGGKRKTVSINGVNVRVVNNRGQLNIPPEHVPPNFVMPEGPFSRRPKKKPTAEADAAESAPAPGAESASLPAADPRSAPSLPAPPVEPLSLPVEPLPLPVERYSPPLSPLSELSSIDSDSE